MDGKAIFLDVNCSYSAFGYSRFIKLNNSELNGYKEKGKLYLNDLGIDIEYYGLDKKYLKRHIDDELSKLAYSTIMEFKNKKLLTRHRFHTRFRLLRSLF